MMHTWWENCKWGSGDNFRNLVILFPAAEHFTYLTNRIYSKIRLKSAEWRGYYLIWQSICMEFFAKKEISISKKTNWIFILLTAVLFLPASYFIYMAEQGNFHPITQGEAYRSAQLDRDELKHYIRKCNINSIINLRGKRTGRSWYQEELDICKQYGCRHYDLSISADKSPSRVQLKMLLHLFENAPRPVLLHCKAGADRAGLAAALWKVVVDREPKALAGKQLSLRFGHFAIGPTSALDEFFKRWQPGQI
jgi:undecaprenyl-diphosphatase